MAGAASGYFAGDAPGDLVHMPRGTSKMRPWLASVSSVVYVENAPGVSWERESRTGRAFQLTRSWLGSPLVVYVWAASGDLVWALPLVRTIEGPSSCTCLHLQAASRLHLENDLLLALAGIGKAEQITLTGTPHWRCGLFLSRYIMQASLFLLQFRLSHGQSQ